MIPPFSVPMILSLLGLTRIEAILFELIPELLRVQVVQFEPSNFAKPSTVPNQILPVMS